MNGKKIIAFSLYGEEEAYRLGALANCDLAAAVYPGWTCRIYVSQDIPAAFNEQLRARGAEVVVKEQVSNTDGMFWRFLPAADPEVDATIVRDIDSRLSHREKVAVDEWLASGKRLHVIAPPQNSKSRAIPRLFPEPIEHYPFGGSM